MSNTDWDTADSRMLEALRADAETPVDGSSRARVLQRLTQSLAAAPAALGGSFPTGSGTAEQRIMAGISTLAARGHLRSVALLLAGGIAGYGLSSAVHRRAATRESDAVASAIAAAPVANQRSAPEPARDPAQAAGDAQRAIAAVASENRPAARTSGASDARSLAAAPPPAPSVVASSASAAVDDSAENTTFREQLALLDAARAALARREPASALGIVAEHQARYPKSWFEQEREALAIKSLVALGRTAEARTRAQGFEQRYPDSLLLPSLRDVVRTKP